MALSFLEELSLYFTTETARLLLGNIDIICNLQLHIDPPEHDCRSRESRPAHTNVGLPLSGPPPADRAGHLFTPPALSCFITTAATAAFFLLTPHTIPSSTMDRRTGESPMDFEWQTRAPGDVTSPFYQLGLQHDQKSELHP